MVLSIKLKTLCMLGKYYTSWLHVQPEGLKASTSIFRDQVVIKSGVTCMIILLHLPCAVALCSHGQ